LSGAEKTPAREEGGGLYPGERKEGNPNLQINSLERNRSLPKTREKKEPPARKGGKGEKNPASRPGRARHQEKNDPCEISGAESKKETPAFLQERGKLLEHRSRTPSFTV